MGRINKRLAKAFEVLSKPRTLNQVAAFYNVPMPVLMPLESATYQNNPDEYRRLHEIIKQETIKRMEALAKEAGFDYKIEIHPELMDDEVKQFFGIR